MVVHVTSFFVFRTKHQFDCPPVSNKRAARLALIGARVGTVFLVWFSQLRHKASTLR